mgnify:CR=1 FL=1
MEKINFGKIDIIRTLAWTMICVVIVEWFPYFLEIMLNFFGMDIRNIALNEIVLILAFAITPFSSIILVFLGAKFSKAMKKIVYVLSIIGLISLTIIGWLTYSSYYQIYPFTTPETGVLDSQSSITGFLGYLNDLPKIMIYAMNGIIFVLVLPVLYFTAQGNGGKLRLDRETNFGMLVGAIYLFLRPGSIAGVPLRIAIISLVITGIFMFFSNQVFSNDDSQIMDKRDGYLLITPDRIPKWSEGGLSFILLFSIIAPSLMMNGLLYNSWVWIFFAISLALSDILIQRRIFPKKRFLSFIYIILLMMVQVLLIYAAEIPVLITIEPYLQSSNLILVALFIPATYPYFKQARENKYLVHPIRQMGFSLMSLLGFLLPFVAVLLPPLSTLIVMVFSILTYGLMVLALEIAFRKNKSRNIDLVQK